MRDIGIEMATGKYMMFVDSDDFLHPQTVELSVESIEAHQAQMAEFGFVRVSNDNVSRKSISFPEVEIIEGCTAIERCSNHVSWNKVYLRNLIEEHRLRFVHRCFEDTAFTRS